MGPALRIGRPYRPLLAPMYLIDGSSLCSNNAFRRRSRRPESAPMYFIDGSSMICDLLEQSFHPSSSSPPAAAAAAVRCLPLTSV